MIYFVFPVFNEEANIRNLVVNLRKKMVDKKYKIIAVNDGSSDRSLDILNELMDENLIIDGSVINMNVGAVFSVGISRVLSESQNPDDIMIIMESDQTSEVDLVDELISSIQKGEKDIVIASRYKGEGEYVNFPFLRTIFSRCANVMMHHFFPIKDVIDYTIFFRAYRIGILKKAVKYFGRYGLIQSKGFVANAELLIKLSLITDRIREIPFVYNYAKKKGASKLNVFRTINEYFVLVSYLKRIFKKVSKWKKQNAIEGVLK